MLPFTNPSAPISLLAAACLLLLPTAARAEIFCVHNPAGCAGTAKPKLQDALNAAAANGNSRDKIYLGVGLFNDGKSTNVAGSPVDIIGTASNQTALTATAGVTPILDIQEPTTEISNLRVHAHTTTAGATTGIHLRGSALGIFVSNQGFGGTFDGIRMLGGEADLRNSTVSLVYPDNVQYRAVFVSSATDATIVGSYLQGTVGISAAASSFAVRRTKIWAEQGILSGSASAGDVRDTSIVVPGSLPSNFQAAALGGHRQREHVPHREPGKRLQHGPGRVRRLDGP